MRVLALHLFNGLFEVLGFLVHFEQRVAQVEKSRLFLDVFLRQKTVVLDKAPPCSLHGSGGRTVGELGVDYGIIALDEGFQLVVTTG